MNFVIFLLIVAVIIFILLTPFLILQRELQKEAAKVGVHISVWQVLLMKFRAVDANIIFRAMIMLHEAGLSNISSDELEELYVAGGNVMNVATALVTAKENGIDLSFKRAQEIELTPPTRQDVREAATPSVKVLEEQQILQANDLKALYLARGNVENVVFALVEASEKGIILSFRTAGNIVLAGHDVLRAVRKGVNPLTGKLFAKIENTNK